MANYKSMRTISFGLVVFAISCASVRVGPETVKSSGLGYESPYSGVVATSETSRNAWLTNVDAGVYDAHKLNVGGWGYRVGVMFGRKINDSFSLLIGARFLGQKTYAWSKTKIKPEIEARFNARTFEFRVAANGLDEESGRSLRISTLTKTEPVVRASVEETWFDSNYKRKGTRVSLALLWRVR